MENVYLLLYVDDKLLAESSKDDLVHVKDLLSKEFDMKDMGESRNILRVDITRDRDQSILTSSQSTYCEKVIRRLNLTHVRPVTLLIEQHFKLPTANSHNDTNTEHKQQMENVPYSQVVGSLIYLMISTRPDLSYSVSLVNRYKVNPENTRHWEATRWILRYLI